MFFAFYLNQAFSFSWRHAGHVEGNQILVGFACINTSVAYASRKVKIINSSKLI